MAKSFGTTERISFNPLLPDPEPAERHFPIISVDDHFVEPGDIFTKRVSSRFGDDIPRIVPTDDGAETWQFPKEQVPNRMTLTSIVGRPVADWCEAPVRLDECRKGAYDVHARVRDLDLAGIAASLCFPSILFGFVGRRLYDLPSNELGMACIRAYNDWVIEDWTSEYPDRFIPQQLAWLPDPAVAAGDIRVNATRGFKAVSFSENPEGLGFPSIHNPHWWPFFEACEETGTVVNLHIGSSSRNVSRVAASSDCPIEVVTSMFGVNALLAAVDWVYSGVPSRFPELKIVMSESGIDWIPFVIDRLIRFERQSEGTDSWKGRDLSPLEVFRRNFWFTTLEDPIGIEMRHHIGVDRIMVECDYPHPDTLWPGIQDFLRESLSELKPEEIDCITWKNARDVYGLELPAP
jgi:predicted TIM-barrel fold metal-dependent hydrolase